MGVTLSGFIKKFINLKQPYNSVNREALLQPVVEAGVPIKLINLTRVSMKNSKGTVKIQNNTPGLLTLCKDLDKLTEVYPFYLT